MKKLSVRIITILFTILLILPMIALAPISAEGTVSESFLHTLLKDGNAELPYEVKNEVYDAICTDSGCDDIAKTYMFTGAPKGTLSGGVQLFENGRYEDGKFVPDYKALADYLTRALDAYHGLESTLSELERVRARAIIAHAFERLPLAERLSVEGAPYRLVGADCRELYVLEYVEDTYVRVNSGGECIPIYPDDTDNTEDYARKIRNDGEIYSHGLLFDVSDTTELKISVPRGSYHFTAVMSSDTSSADIDYGTVGVSVYVTDSSGTETELATYLLYKGYECRIDLPLDGITDIRLSFSCDTEGMPLRCILGDGVFLGEDDSSDGSLGSAARRVGDVNRDGVINTRDVSDLAEVILGNMTSDLYVCDADMNGRVDMADMLVLKNYLIFLGNSDREHNKERSQFLVLSLGDSIARGSGLDPAETFDSSAQAYGARVARFIESSTGYEVKYTNYGTDGITVSDLVYQLQNRNDVRESVKDADLITLSIGGNDFMQGLTAELGDRYGMTFNDLPSAFMHILGNEDPIAFLEYLMSEQLTGELEKDALERAATLSRAGELLKELNPDAEIMLITIPNTAVQSRFVMELSLGGLGVQVLPLFNVHELFDAWIAPYNDMILQSSAEYFETVDLRATFNGDHALSLMDIDETVNVMDLIGGDTSSIRRFDVHPSAEGHSRIADEHTELLDSLVDELKANYKEEGVAREDYLYSSTLAKTELPLTSALAVGEDLRLTYRVEISDTSDLENLLMTVEYDSRYIELDETRQSGLDGARIFQKQGRVVILITDPEKISDMTELEITFINVSPEDTEVIVSVSAEEARMTVDGIQRRQASASDGTEISAAPTDEPSGDPQGGLLDWFAQNGGLLDLTGKGGAMSKVVAYTVFVLAALILAGAILTVVAVVTAKSKKNKNKSERGIRK